MRAISTHTPARGVTADLAEDVENCKNFYSHAREGRDLSGISDRLVTRNFYSHAREGRDHGNSKLIMMPMVISTHTPARGVTKMSQQ